MRIQREEAGRRVRYDSISERSENVWMSNCVCSVEVDFEFPNFTFALRSEEVGCKEFEDVGSRESGCLILKGDLS